MKKYNLDYYIDYFSPEIPEGYKKLKGAMTAPRGFEWYWNSKNFFSDERKIILVKMPIKEISPMSSKKTNIKTIEKQLQLNFESFSKKKVTTLDINTRLALNNLARHQLKQKLLADIATDITICNIEKWDYKEFIDDLIRELERITKVSGCSLVDIVNGDKQEVIGNIYENPELLENN